MLVKNSNTAKYYYSLKQLLVCFFLNFKQPLFQSSVSHDASEKNLIIIIIIFFNFVETSIHF